MLIRFSKAKRIACDHDMAKTGLSISMDSSDLRCTHLFSAAICSSASDCRSSSLPVKTSSACKSRGSALSYSFTACLTAGFSWKRDPSRDCSWLPLRRPTRELRAVGKLFGGSGERQSFEGTTKPTHIHPEPIASTRPKQSGRRQQPANVPHGIERIQTVTLGDDSLNIDLHRMNDGKHWIWIFSAQTLAKVPSAYAYLNGSSFERRLPAFLTKPLWPLIPLWRCSGLYSCTSCDLRYPPLIEKITVARLSNPIRGGRSQISKAVGTATNHTCVVGTD